MAMGIPLSPLLSNLYMEIFEKELLPKILPHNVVWKRYVDDILCIWPLDHGLHSFLSKLNGLIPSIKFTSEPTIDNELIFLDILPHRSGRYFKNDAFRKHTNVLSYVHYYSAPHEKTKLSVFSSMFFRADRISSPEFLSYELSKIYCIAYHQI
ncbi:uncharacterized protein LOC143024019 [Oratosquilla oratoria]|uniref:uncharacterized protein LOC143024019 n=1 Tax=Oratosquilla oratoria TaxID=337810 RepID=UPI003F773D2E